LGIFQKLLSAKSSEASGFDLLEAIIRNFPVTAINTYMNQVFVILMTRLMQSRTETLVLRFLKLFYFLSSRTKENEGPDWLIAKIDSVQDGIFGEIYQAFILSHTQKLTKFLDRKIAIVGLTKLITSSKTLLSQSNRYHQKFWPASVTTLLKLLETPPVPTNTDAATAYDQSAEADLDDVSFSVSFATLNTARKGAVDPFPEILDARKWVGEELRSALSGPNGPDLRNSLGQLGAGERSVLESYS